MTGCRPRRAIGGEVRMLMNEFRILSGEVNGCYIRVGELMDTDTGEVTRLLYLRRIEGHVDQKTEHTLFLCPKHVDLAVLGTCDKTTMMTWYWIAEQTQADVLVAAGTISKDLPGAEQVICLTAERNTCEYRGAGWKFFVQATATSVMVTAKGSEKPQCVGHTVMKKGVMTMTGSKGELEYCTVTRQTPPRKTRKQIIW